MHTSSPPNFNILAQGLEPEVFSPRSPPPDYERIHDNEDFREVAMDDVFSNPGRRDSKQQAVESSLWISVPETQVGASPTVGSPTEQAQEMRQHQSPVAPFTVSYASASSISSPSQVILSPLDISAPADTSTGLQPHSLTITEQPRPLDHPVPSSPRAPTSSKEPSQPRPRRTLTVNDMPPRDPRANCLHGNHEMAFQSSQAGIRLAMLFFPFGLLCCWVSRKERCTHCGKTAEELQMN